MDQKVYFGISVGSSSRRQHRSAWLELRRSSAVPRETGHSLPLTSCSLRLAPSSPRLPWAMYRPQDRRHLPRLHQHQQ
ncbi:hypothetical protein E2C01_001413 [Portunus trituberculatus]|uniref:Uncharacterized protein n=1 Tax=Portunus trituberculatus TaxID=210409 RepID=A0A5B7CH83_PORTR|nr:hypothetical protein [Portunus trituberculatus]